jgi:aminoglycoside phosphotransferase (APT) family kinase protein
MTDDGVLDLEALRTWLAQRRLARGPIRATRIGDGHSNLTYAVDGGERTVVVRRPPPPPIPPGANDVLREARLLQALAPTAVPVPEVLAVGQAGEAMDVPFYVMEHLDGEVATTELPAALDVPLQRTAVAHAMIDALVELHAVDWKACGLGDLARPEGFLRRQLDRLPRLLSGSEASLPEEMSALHEELLAELPVSGAAALVHGDLRLGNVMLARAAPARILGVLDWELAGVGDPLTDLGYTLATYAVPDEPLHALTELSSATLQPGFPSREELAVGYAQRTGRDIGALAWYEAFALWKLAVLFEYGRRRHLAGAGDPYYADPALVGGLLAAARRAMRASQRPIERSSR